jgi:hypothetical protein
VRHNLAEGTTPLAFEDRGAGGTKSSFESDKDPYKIASQASREKELTKFTFSHLVRLECPKSSNRS